jgi:hypothetical protein
LHGLLLYFNLTKLNNFHPEDIMNASTRFVFLLILCLLFTSLSFGQKQSWNLNFKGGVLLPGTVYIAEFDVDVGTEMGWIANLTYDAMVGEKISMGGYFFYSGTTAEESSETVNVMSIGGTLKGRFVLQGGIQIRPGIIVAYQIASGAFDDVKGLNLGFTGEVAFPLQNMRAIVAELGFTSQPTGGNPDSDVTWSPIFYLMLGYEFGG